VPEPVAEGQSRRPGLRSLCAAGAGADGGVILADWAPPTPTVIRALIEARGAQVACLLPYAPDLNRIETCGFKVKAALRTTKARTAAGRCPGKPSPTTILA
jgi:hypothetical protein